MGKRVVFVLAVIILMTAGLLFWSKSMKPPLQEKHHYGTVKDKIEDVSLINLIATPERYHGRRVRVIGVANFEFEGNALYLSKADVNLVTKNAVWLSPDTATLKVTEPTLAHDFNGQYVLVEGLFNMNNHGHLGMASGAITNINRIMSWGRN
ncbi:MAG: hypothetical protein HYS23_11550 [Geobacter sp.]|nr:hypothetical protein [Geobacter sp.]